MAEKCLVAKGGWQDSPSSGEKLVARSGVHCCVTGEEGPTALSVAGDHHVGNRKCRHVQLWPLAASAGYGKLSVIVWPNKPRWSKDILPMIENDGHLGVGPWWPYLPTDATGRTPLDAWQCVPAARPSPHRCTLCSWPLWLKATASTTSMGQ